MQEFDYVTFMEAANDPSKLRYDPEHPDAEGRIEIGTLMSDGFDACRWSIVPLEGGWAIEIESICDGMDENGELVESDHSKAYFLPVESISDEKERTKEQDQVRFDDLPDVVPHLFNSVEEAFDTFLDVVYSDDKVDFLYEVKQSASNLLNGYADPENDDFEKFKKDIENVLSWDDHGHSFHMTKVANAMLCVRYPFLIPWGHMNDASPWAGRDMFDYTLFISIPGGWARRFGLEMCEDLRNQAYDEDNRVWEWRLCQMRVDQIKEKFGGLRWYGTTYGRGGSLIDAYEHISYNVCIDCGKAEDTRITRGWITPICWKDVFGSEAKNAFRDEDKAIYLAGEEDPSWDKVYAAYTLGEYVRAIEATAAASNSRDMKEMLSKWEWKRYNKEHGEETVNKALGLLDGTPAPNGQPVWARRVIEEVAAEIGAREDRTAPDAVMEALEVLGLGREALPAWYDEKDRDEDA